MIPRFKEIHIENTNSCGYKCVMCPRESHTRQIGFMPIDDFELVLNKIESFQGVFHLHGYGEPLLDRFLIPKVSLLHKKFPSSLTGIFSTLGVKVKEDYFERLLEAGLNVIVISLYGFTVESYKKVHGVDRFELVKQNLQSLSQAMKQFSHSFKPVVKIPGSKTLDSLSVEEPPEKTDFCRWVNDLGFNISQWNYVHNYGEGRNYNLPNTEKICPVVTGKRKEILNITWDLNVIPCCYDYNASIRFGNLRDQTLDEIFSSPEYLAFLIAQQTNQLAAYPVCQNCEKQDYS